MIPEIQIDVFALSDTFTDREKNPLVDIDWLDQGQKEEEKKDCPEKGQERQNNLTTIIC